jgi:hypothetical protein
MWSAADGLRLPGVKACVLADSSLDFTYDAAALPAPVATYFSLRTTVYGTLARPSSVGVTAAFDFKPAALTAFVQPALTTYAGKVSAWFTSITAVAATQLTNFRSQYDAIKAAAIAAYPTLASSIADNEALRRALAAAAEEDLDLAAEEEFVRLLRIVEGPGGAEGLRALRVAASESPSRSPAASASSSKAAPPSASASTSRRPSASRSRAAAASQTAIRSLSSSRTPAVLTQGQHLDRVLAALTKVKDFVAITQGLALLTGTTLSPASGAVARAAAVHTKLALSAPPVFLALDYTFMGAAGKFNMTIAAPLSAATTTFRVATAVKTWVSNTYLTPNAAVQKYLAYMGGAVPAAQ